MPLDGTTGAWFDRETAGCRLADRRLDKRLRSLLERMGDAMGARGKPSNENDPFWLAYETPPPALV